jgi:pterin-4a-carbinolamine dehydratase
MALRLRKEIALSLHKDEFDGMPKVAEFLRKIDHHPLSTATA